MFSSSASSTRCLFVPSSSELSIPLLRFHRTPQAEVLDAAGDVGDHLIHLNLSMKFAPRFTVRSTSNVVVDRITRCPELIEATNVPSEDGKEQVAIEECQQEGFVRAVIFR